MSTSNYFIRKSRPRFKRVQSQKPEMYIITQRRGFEVLEDSVQPQITRDKNLSPTLSPTGPGLVSGLGLSPDPGHHYSQSCPTGLCKASLAEFNLKKATLYLRYSESLVLAPRKSENGNSHFPLPWRHQTLGPELHNGDWGEVGFDLFTGTLRSEAYSPETPVPSR
ncbi:hypothetical protein B0H13DRAFT_1900435 [Mycena leptocephala]|nr:hypothetical protein B0H13DRAFT_1900435 [Mycena leptocephala]